MKIDGVLHEFSSIPGVKEDVTEIIMNIKSLSIKNNSDSNEVKTAYIEFEGEGVITAADIQADPDIEIMNPDQVIATLDVYKRQDVRRCNAMDLSNLQPAVGSKHSDNFRRGRGHGSGNGKTAGKGHKGQKARSGATRPGFEGGQMPLYRRLPKRGFKNRNTKTIVGINVSALECFENDAVVTVESLMECGIVKNPRDGVKLLGNGELTKKLTVKVDAFSEGAKAKIEALGCLLYTSRCV